jgi:pimeloyl-ACP methyl ester carboxylesterase
VFAEVVSDRGRGPTTLVYLPGIDGSGELLLGTAARLEQRFRLIRLRYRLSSNPEHRTYTHLASSAIAAVSLRGVDRPLLLAESFGGAVALRAALDFPDRVAAVALVNTFAFFRRRLRLRASRVGLRLSPPWALGLGRRLLAPALLFSARRDTSTVAEFDASTGGSWRLPDGYPTCLRMIQGLDLRDELGAVRQPVALFASGRDRIVDSVRQAREMERLLPDVEVEVFEDRGHVVLPVGEIDWPARLERLAQRAHAPSAAPE